MEAGKDSARTRGKGCRPKGAYYAPAARIDLVPGVSKSEGAWPWTDRYSGTLEALVASGIVPRALMPGEPGAPASSVSYRPEGTPKSAEGWHRTPGYIQIFRNATGTFRAELTVSAEEQDRREALHAKKSDATNEQVREPIDAPPLIARQLRLAGLVEALVALYGVAAVDGQVQRFRRERPRRPMPAYLRLAWASPT